MNPANDSVLKNYLDSVYARRVGFLHNGDMSIDQRNAGAAVTWGSAGLFPVDRWKALATAGGNTAQRSTTVPTGGPFKYSTVLTVGAGGAPAAGDLNGFYQLIEGIYTQPWLFGGTYAKRLGLGFWVRASVIGAYGVTLRNAAVDRSYVGEYVIQTANTWEFKTVWFPGCPDGTWPTTEVHSANVWFDLGSGSTYEGTANTWASANKTRTSSQVKLIQTAGATFYITGVSLLFDYVDQRWLLPDPVLELYRCQRYYEQMLAYVPTSPMYVTLPYVRKRVIPTITGTGTGFTTDATEELTMAWMNQDLADEETITVDAEM